MARRALQRWKDSVQYNLKLVTEFAFCADAKMKSLVVIAALVAAPLAARVWRGSGEVPLAKWSGFYVSFSADFLTTSRGDQL